MPLWKPEASHTRLRSLVVQVVPPRLRGGGARYAARGAVRVPLRRPIVRHPARRAAPDAIMSGLVCNGGAPPGPGFGVGLNEGACTHQLTVSRLQFVTNRNPQVSQARPGFVSEQMKEHLECGMQPLSRDGRLRCPTTNEWYGIAGPERPHRGARGQKAWPSAGRRHRAGRPEGGH